MYVAVTRARERLYLSCAQSRALHGQTHYHLRSRFLDEVPVELVKWLTSGTRFSRSGTVVSGGFGRVAAPAASLERGLPGGLRIGQNVRHPRFGLGVIVAAEGVGDEAKAQINFGDAGVKWLLLSLAKLEAA
jgi:DNA helicase-2/ATP-dependent DNA helicase PcrA